MSRSPAISRSCEKKLKLIEQAKSIKKKKNYYSNYFKSLTCKLCMNIFSRYYIKLFIHNL